MPRHGNKGLNRSLNEEFVANLFGKKLFEKKVSNNLEPNVKHINSME